MSVGERVGGRKAGLPHVCQFFDCEESRADAAAAFVAEGIRAGDHVIVVVRPAHWEAIHERLTAQQVPVERARAEQRLVVRDAADTLRRISPNGSPSASAFAEVAGEIRALAERCRVRAYGEMVDILAERGDLLDALKLETMWNQLAEVAPFSIFCGYMAAHFAPPATHQALRNICAAHTDVRRNEQDALANWLLTNAHTSGSSLSH